MHAILGATGKIGGATLRELRQRGLPVRAVIRDPAKAKQFAQSGCEVAVADVHDANALKAALAGASDVFVICPMNPKVPDARPDHEHMIAAIGTALEHVNPRSIVAISDYGAHHTTGTGIALTFHRFEQMLRSIPVPCTIIRSAEHIQNWSRFMKIAADSGVLPTFYCPSTKLLPIVSAPDVGVIAADGFGAERPQVIHVEGPRRYSVDEVVKAMGAALGRPIEGREVPPGRWVPTLLEGGLSESYAQLLSEMYEAHNAGRIDIESEFGHVRRGTTSLSDAFAALSAH